MPAARRRSVGAPAECGVCAHRWPAAARYCGHCGASLQTGDGPAAPRRRGAVRLGTGLLITGLAVAVAAVAGPGFWSPPTLDPPSPGPEAAGRHGDVEVPRPGAEVATDRPGTDTPTARGQVTPPMLRCTPGPCVHWRRPGTDLRAERVAVDGDLVVTASDDAITGLDARSGRTRWQTPVREVLAATPHGAGQPASSDDASSPTRLDASIHVMVAMDGDAVVVSVPERVALLDRADGSLRWTVASPGWWVWDVELLDEVVVLLTRTGRGGSPYPRLAVLERRTGAPIWDQVVGAVVDLDDEALIARSGDGTLVAFDPVTGAVRWRDASHTATPLVTRQGGWLLHHDPGVVRLLDPASGRETTRLAGSPGPFGLQLGEITVLVLLRDPPDQAETQLVAINADGQPRWQQPIAGDEHGRCCQALLPHADGVALIAEDGRMVVHDLDTGQPLPGSAPAPLPGPVQARSDRVLVTVAAGPGLPPPFGIQALSPRRQHTRVMDDRAVAVSVEPLVVLVDGAVVGIDPWQGRLPPPEARRVRP